MGREVLKGLRVRCPRTGLRLSAQLCITLGRRPEQGMPTQHAPLSRGEDGAAVHLPVHQKVGPLDGTRRVGTGGEAIRRVIETVPGAGGFNRVPQAQVVACFMRGGGRVRTGLPRGVDADHAGHAVSLPLGAVNGAGQTEKLPGPYLLDEEQVQSDLRSHAPHLEEQLFFSLGNGVEPPDRQCRSSRCRRE